MTSLGLLSLLSRYVPPEKLGYIKPVGQELVELPDGSRVDKDAVIINRFGGIGDIDMRYVSPVRLGSGFTKRFLKSDNAEAEARVLKTSILEAFASMEDKKFIVAEGTGHPGVGGIVNLSNAQVAKLIDGDVIFLSGGGIGKALDMLEVDLSYFMYKKTRVRGIIFNKLIPEKIPVIREYLTEDLLNSKYPFFDSPLRIFGYLPEVNDLSKPSMSLIADEIPSSAALGNVADREWHIPTSAIKAISLSAKFFKPEWHLVPGDVVLIGSAYDRRIPHIVAFHKHLRNYGTVTYEGEKRGLGGLILTCGDRAPLDERVRTLLDRTNLPALYVQQSTAVTEKLILNAFQSTKLQEYDDHKIHEISELFEKHFDIEKFFDTFDITAPKKNRLH